MVLIPILVLARQVGTCDGNRRVTEVKRHTKQLIELFRILVNPLKCPGFIRHTDSKHTTISVCHCHDGHSQSLRINLNALAIKRLILLSGYYFLYSHLHMIRNKLIKPLKTKLFSNIINSTTSSSGRKCKLSKISQMFIVTIILRFAKILIIIHILKLSKLFSHNTPLLKWIGNCSLTSWTLYIEILQIPFWLFIYMNDFSNCLLP